MIKQQIKDSIIVGLIVAVIVLATQFAVGHFKGTPSASFGAVGGLLIENYDPYVMSNGGINTALPFQTSGGIVNSGTFTQSGAFNQTGSLTIGTNGTAITAIKAGACTIWAPATTIAASTTQQVECQGATTGGISAITGITTDAICQLTNASSTNTTSNSIVVAGVSASSTAGTLVARLSNLTGATFTWTSAASSSPKWQYSCIDPT